MRFIVEKSTFNYLAMALVDIPAVRMPFACSPNLQHLALTTAYFRLAFVPSTRCPCVMIMLFNQLLEMPHLSGAWITLEDEKCSLMGM
jgi:hypothetical protein